jgi:hypothetical protein
MGTKTDRFIGSPPTWAVLLLAALGIVSVPAAVRAAAPAPRATQPLVPFDLTYLPPHSPVRLVLIRPAELARFAPPRSSLPHLFDSYAWMFIQFASGNQKAATPPAFAEIEQAAFNINLQIICSKEGDHGNLILGTSSMMLRTVKPFDWSGRVAKWFPKAERVRHSGREYVRAKFNLAALGSKGEISVAFFVPDQRTLVVDNDDSIRKLLEELQAGRTFNLEKAGLDKIGKCHVAGSFDNRDRSWLQGKPKADTPEAKAEVLLIESLDRVVLEMTIGERSAIKLTATARSKAAAREVVKVMKALLDAGVRNLPPPGRGQAAEARAKVHFNQSGSLMEVNVELPGNILLDVLGCSPGDRK